MNVDQSISTTVTTDAYYDGLSDERKPLLKKIQKAIFRVWPDIDEQIIKGIPTYSLDGSPFLSMASRKNYVALYIVPHDLLNVFKTELRQYDHGRSCIRFKKLDPALFDLIERIILYTGSQLSTSKFFKKELSLDVIDAECDR